jgi:hypothetical protein
MSVNGSLITATLEHDGCRDERASRLARRVFWQEEFPLMVAWAFGE